ncbi:hypothetical protein Val02_68220 [Virgisporangium aliadipatigenens]|uniref:Uncharacterized protein n=1 Tax=Virgisporangium aliadipatigenens TaxID=741659 RepID=A0A8J3YR58_9ACTN|nr:hypothetical protein [Virgisporangium aliadipatigenens]GIJ49936.1 hypothetical protein Val02_68220 [Virgisporangium aliadipatigenens]
MRVIIVGGGLAGLATADVEDAIPHAEPARIADGYQRTAGFDPALLNERESFGVRR